MGFYRGPQIVTSGLVLHLDAANPKSYPGTGTTWYDRAGNLNGGVVNNATLYNGPSFSSTNMGSLVFNGTNSYVRVDSTILQDSGGTINIWCKPTGVPPTGFTGYIFSSFGTNSDRFYMYIDTSGNFGIARGNPMVGIAAGVKPLNIWYNLVMVWTSTTLSGYFNGIQFGATTSYIASGTTSNFSIGSYVGPFGTQVFNGNIANVQIYNRALTAQEVLQNYNALKSRFI